jgi:hypothetical protein
MATVDRAPRETDVRDAAIRGMSTRNPEEFRKYVYKPADALPMPQAPPGIRYRYVRRSINGEPDNNNFGKMMREGWATVPLGDHPDLATSVNESAKNSGLIEIGDLILCKIPTEIMEARNLYYANMNLQQMAAVDSNLMKESDPRMPIFNNRESKVTFGKGS